MLTSTRPRSPTRPSAVKKPRSPAWLISPFRMNSSISRSTQDPWLTLSTPSSFRHKAFEPVSARRLQAKRTRKSDQSQTDKRAYRKLLIVLQRARLSASGSGLLDAFTAPECANYFAAAGYDPT